MTAALLGHPDLPYERLLHDLLVVADMADFAAMNEVWETWVSPGNTPARATGEAKLAAPEYKVSSSSPPPCRTDRRASLPALRPPVWDRPGRDPRPRRRRTTAASVRSAWPLLNTEIPGFVWAYRFDPVTGLGRPLPATVPREELVVDEGFVWLHLALSDARVPKFLEGFVDLPVAARPR